MRKQAVLSLRISDKVFYEMAKYSQFVIDMVEEVQDSDLSDSETRGCLSYDINNALHIIDPKRVDDIKILNMLLETIKNSYNA